MLFANLSRISAFVRHHLRFVKSSEDWNILIAIGNAQEQGEPIGFKQLVLMEVASPSTLTRRLKNLSGENIIRRVVQASDGRMVTYTLTKAGLEAFRRYERFLRAVRWDGRGDAES